jgi:signal transduction histidine kinase
MFTDDDAAVLDAIIQAALPYLELLTFQERQLSAVTRMAHEFQVPMVAIRAAVDYMQHTLRSKSINVKELFGEDYLGDVLNWSGIMGRLANSARIFAAGAGSVDLRPIRTKLKSEVVAPAVHQVNELLRDHGFDVSSILFTDFADLPALWIDRHQFQQVFFNLLSNSIKYADRGRLKVKIDAGRHGSAFMIWFQDWGPGIEAGSEELIFQPGYRSRDALRRDVSGQGIGLGVVRSIVEAHGGRIRLASNCQPTTFEIALPSSLQQNPPAKKANSN